MWETIFPIFSTFTLSVTLDIISKTRQWADTPSRLAGVISLEQQGLSSKKPKTNPSKIHQATLPFKTDWKQAKQID